MSGSEGDYGDNGYGRKPVPPERFVAWTLETALNNARDAVRNAEIEVIKTKADHRRACDEHLNWLGRISHLEAAIAALEAVPAAAPPSPQRGKYPALLSPCPFCGLAHWTDESCIGGGAAKIQTPEALAAQATPPMPPPNPPCGSSHLLSDDEQIQAAAPGAAASGEVGGLTFEIEPGRPE